MGKIGSFTHVSLDGYFAGPNGEIDWFKTEDEEDREFSARASRPSGTLVFGRTTYELMAGYWPTADADPASSPLVAEFARIWRDMPKVVFSRTLERADWNATVVPELVPAEIMELKAQPGGDMVLGGAELAAAFMRHDLIDEYRLYVHPVLIGRGKPLFQPSDATISLRLAGTRTFGSGVVLLCYQRPGAHDEESGDARAP